MSQPVLTRNLDSTIIDGMATNARKRYGPDPETEWRTGLAITYDRIDEEVAEELERIPLQPSGQHSVLAEHAALTRVAERRTAETVAFARQNGMSWAWVGDQLGVTPQAAQQRFGKLPKPPYTIRSEHGPECGEAMIPERLRRDRKAWGCKCGVVGVLD